MPTYLSSCEDEDTSMALTPRRAIPNAMPFFLRMYVKHSSDNRDANWGSPEWRKGQSLHFTEKGVFKAPLVPTWNYPRSYKSYMRLASNLISRVSTSSVNLQAAFPEGDYSTRALKSTLIPSPSRTDIGMAKSGN